MPATGSVSGGGALTPEQKKIAEMLARSKPVLNAAARQAMADDPRTALAKSLAATASNTGALQGGTLEGLSRIGSGLLGKYVGDKNRDDYRAISVAQSGAENAAKEQARQDLIAGDAADRAAYGRAAPAPPAPAAAVDATAPPAPAPAGAPPGGPLKQLPPDFMTGIAQDMTGPPQGPPPPPPPPGMPGVQGAPPPGIQPPGAPPPNPMVAQPPVRLGTSPTPSASPVPPSAQSIPTSSTGLPAPNATSDVIVGGSSSDGALQGGHADDTLRFKGGTRAIDGNNPSGIVDGRFASRQPGYVGGNGKFAAFKTMEDGANAQKALLRSYISRGFDTPAKIAARWASGPTDKPGVYAETVAKAMGIGVNDKVSASNLDAFAKHQAQLETGSGIKGTATTDTMAGGDAADQVPVPALPAAAVKPDRPAERARIRSARMALVDSLLQRDNPLGEDFKAASIEPYYDKALDEDYKSREDSYRTQTGLDKEEYQQAMTNFYAQNRDLSKQQLDERSEAIKHNYKMVEDATSGGGILDGPALQIAAETYIATGVLPAMGSGKIGSTNKKNIYDFLAKNGYSAKDIVRGGVGYTGDKAAARTAGVIEGRVTQSIEELKAAIPLAQKARLAVPRGKFVPLNKVMNWSETELASNPAMAELRAKVTAVDNAYDQLAARGGTDTAKREEARRNLSLAQSPEAFDAALKAYMQEAIVAGEASKRAMQIIRSNSVDDGTPAGSTMGPDRTPGKKTGNPLVDKYLP